VVFLKLLRPPHAERAGELTRYRAAKKSAQRLLVMKKLFLPAIVFAAIALFGYGLSSRTSRQAATWAPAAW
jgi:hypothetical protein